jgi:hypothetical protein
VKRCQETYAEHGFTETQIIENKSYINRDFQAHDGSGIGLEGMPDEKRPFFAPLPK